MSDAPNHANLAAALAAAQAEITDPKRNKTATVPNRPVRHYAGLDDLLEAVRPVLARHGLAITQQMEHREGRTFLATRLLHGVASLESVWELLAKGDPQSRGSEITYARRYTLEALVGVAATEDDDGADASGVPQQTTPRTRGKRAEAPSPRNSPPPEPSPAPDPPAKPAHHPTWANANKAFCAELRRLGMEYGIVADIAEALGEPRPSAAPPDKRAACLRYFQSQAGRDAYAAKVPGWKPPETQPDAAGGAA